MKANKRPKKTIVKILKEHPEGLTIQKIAEMAKMSRITATKYIHELIGEGRVLERKIGMARLLHLKEKFIETVKKEEIVKKIRKKLK